MINILKGLDMRKKKVTVLEGDERKKE